MFLVSENLDREFFGHSVEECKNKNNECAACLLEREFIRNETPHWP